MALNPRLTEDDSPRRLRADVPADAQALAAGLAPVLVETCAGRLRDIHWFRADWQRGGAATAFAQYDDDAGVAREVVVKIPVGHRELTWMRRLQGDYPDPVVPRLYASGDALGGYEIGWIMIERLGHGPLGGAWHDTEIPRIADAVARFYAQAAAHPVEGEPVREDWDELIKGSRESVKTNVIPQRQRWTNALKALQGKLGPTVERWRARAIADWVHGDLQPANCLCRREGSDAPVTLIDLAEVRPGHWIEDAVYLERLHWSRPQRMAKHKPVREIARARKARGLATGDEYPQLAAIRRALLAATAPRFLKTEGAPAHLAACLERLEQSLAEV